MRRVRAHNSNHFNRQQRGIEQCEAPIGDGPTTKCFHSTSRWIRTTVGYGTRKRSAKGIKEEVAHNEGGTGQLQTSSHLRKHRMPSHTGKGVAFKLRIDEPDTDA